MRSLLVLALLVVLSTAVSAGPLSSHHRPAGGRVHLRAPRQDNCTRAFDTVNSDALSQQAFSCLLNAGYQQVSLSITRDQNCNLDSNLIQTVKNAFQAGLGGADLIIAPANITCNLDPGMQVSQILRLFAQARVAVNRVWLDVTFAAAPGGWNSTDCPQNRQWLGPALRHAQHNIGPDKVGIRSSAADWHHLMCDHNDLRTIALWYVHQDGSASLDDWAKVAFGGWKLPMAKQYDAVNVCGIEVQEDIRRNGVC